MNLTEWSAWSLLPWSSRFLLVAELLAVVCAALAAWSALRHVLEARRRSAGGIVLAGAGGGTVSVDGGDGVAPARPVRAFDATVVALSAAIAALFASLWERAAEVNHFPSQTMGEVLTVFCFCVLLSALVLHFALGLYRRGPGWAVLGDVLTLASVACVLFTIAHIRTQTTAQRDLPPALQSYWFAPHISALVFSYATLGIAGIICILYFVTRFWGGVFLGGRSRRSQVAVFLLLVAVPFVHFVTIPIFLVGGLVLFVLVKQGVLQPGGSWTRFERELDEISFRAFAVGIPFLTAGLWMGAFWAQEAWANYWGWDSKENSALISWLVYIVYIHLRMLGGYRGEKAMAVLVGGALSIFLTFQIFGYLPDSQKNSLHKYTDPEAPAMEGQIGPGPDAQARAGD